MSIYTLLSQSLLSESSACPVLSAGQIWGTYFAEGQGSGDKEEQELSTVGSYLPQDILAPWFLPLIVSSNATWAQDSVSREGGEVFPSPSVACQACGAWELLLSFLHLLTQRQTADTHHSCPEGLVHAYTLPLTPLSFCENSRTLLLGLLCVSSFVFQFLSAKRRLVRGREMQPH